MDYLGVVSEELLCLKAFVVLLSAVIHGALQVKCTLLLDCDVNDVFVLHIWQVSFVACLVGHCGFAEVCV